jgi:ubiquinone/menaquinone biosynthesis C-methylase UbiE
MRTEWNERARTNARWFIASDASSEAEFVESGARDAAFALRGLDRDWLAEAKAIEVGCGAGRMSAFLAACIGSLVAVDVSTEMINLASERLAGIPNVELLATSGEDLGAFQDTSFDLVLSYIVFQHIPKTIVRDYLRDIRRVLTPSGVFRGQLARITDAAYVQPSDDDTFTMRSWSPEEINDALADWSQVKLEIRAVEPTTDHIWITAEP